VVAKKRMHAHKLKIYNMARNLSCSIASQRLAIKENTNIKEYPIAHASKRRKCPFLL
jgi:hypothetical protein